MGFHQDRPARRLVNTPGLHANHPVFHDIHDTDAVFPTEGVQFRDDLGHFHRFAIQAHGTAFFKGHGHIFRLIRRFLRRYAQYQEMFVIRLTGRVFQFQAFMTDVPQIAVAAITWVRRKWQVDPMLPAIFDLILPGLHRPHIRHPPGRDDLQVRRQCLDTQFKTDLVISFARRPMADSRSALLACDLHQPLGDHRAGHGCPQQIFVFINRARFHTGHDVLIAKLIYDIFNIQLWCTRELSPLFEPVQFFSLSTIDTAADHFIVKIFLQPRNDGRRIQTAWIGQHNFFLCHFTSSF